MNEQIENQKPHTWFTFERNGSRSFAMSSSKFIDSNSYDKVILVELSNSILLDILVNTLIKWLSIGIVVDTNDLID